MIELLAVLLWLGIGATIGLVSARRGHWRHTWLLTALLGPAAIVVFYADRRRRPRSPRVLRQGSPGPGSVDVLVGIDGSEAADAVAREAVRLLNPRRLTLAGVLDIESSRAPTTSLLNADPWPEQVDMEAHLAALAEELARDAGVDPQTVVLAGAPAKTLADHAASAGFDLVAIGHRGAGLSKLVLGSCAAGLPQVSAVPVLLLPPPATVGRPAAAARSSSRA